MKKITKLVLPVAGLGKRLMPLTKKTPKNLLLVNGKPLIEYAFEEAIASGIQEVVIIVNPAHQEQFKKYLEHNRKKFPELKFHIRVQHTPAGNGHALLPAEDILRGEPFAVRFCDDILVGNPPIMKTLLNIFSFYQRSVILLERVPRRLVSRFGVVGIKKAKHRPTEVKGNIYEITEVIEKPPFERAPSNLTVVGGYALTPSVFRNLKKVSESLPQAANDAIPINVGLQIELIIGHKIYGWEFNGKRLDCGTLERLEKAQKILKRAAGRE